MFTIAVALLLYGQTPTQKTPPVLLAAGARWTSPIFIDSKLRDNPARWLLLKMSLHLYVKG